MTCMLQDNVARHRDAKGKGDVKGTKLACRKAMCLGTRVLKATQTLHARGYRRRRKAWMSQGDVAKHEGAEGTKLACRKAMWPSTGLSKAQSLHVARRSG
ncbi:unnamed protein product [Prunus armeniaca]